MSSPKATLHTVRTAHIPAGLLRLEGLLKIPDAACGIVLFA